MKKFLMLVFLYQLAAATLLAQTKHPAIPDSIRNYTILVKKVERGIMQKSFNNKLEKAMKDEYDGPFVMVGQEDLKDPQYADTTKYRYMLDVAVVGQKTTNTMVNGMMRERNESIVDVFFLDRSNGTKFPRAGLETLNYITSVRRLSKLLKEQ